MKHHIASLALLAVPLVAACSHDPLEPGQGSDPGSGTGTLFVDGNASAEPHVATATTSLDFSTDFSIRIELNGQSVTTGATVMVRSLNVSTTLTFNPDNGGRWIGTASGYDESYQLDVVSGADKITGVIVDGPTVHRITDPLAGASLDSTMPYLVKWDRNEAAQEASIEVGHIDRLTIADTGSYMVPAGSLDAEKDKTKENTIEIRRSNRISPAGAIGGSSFQVSIRNDIDVLALANPAL
jgi:hypothetical protein